MNIKKVNDMTIIDDCYNASPESMKLALNTLVKQEAKRRIAILGDMLELGEYSEKLHEEIGKYVAKNKINKLIVTGNFSKYIPLGAKRIEAECDDKDIMLIAFEKDNKTVLITANFSEKEKAFVMPYDGLVSVTDKGHNLTEKSVSANEKIAITPQSVTTFVF